MVQIPQQIQNILCRCVIAELFTEGSHPFDLSQLLQYRNKEYSPWKLLEKIDDTDIRVSKTTLAVNKLIPAHTSSTWIWF